MKTTIIRLTDQLRLLDQDMIRLKEKVGTVMELKEENKLKDEKTEKPKDTRTRKKI
jgi:aldehyde:ferredoxin oxidoreductase